MPINKSDLKAYLDMDGILADFIGGICAAHKRSNPYENPANLGIFEMEALLGMTAEEFWRPTNEEGWWYGLEPMSDAFTIVSTLEDEIHPKNIAILTSPALSPFCVDEKRKWIQRYFPELSKNIIFTGAKHMIAGPGRILIDDADKNIDAWRQHGGTGVLVPRLWNSAYAFNGRVAFDEALGGGLFEALVG